MHLFHALHADRAGVTAYWWLAQVVVANPAYVSPSTLASAWPTCNALGWIRYKPKYGDTGRSRHLSTEGRGLLIRGMIGAAAGDDGAAADGGSRRDKGSGGKSASGASSGKAAGGSSASAAHAPVDLGGGWIELYDESKGRPYYFNRTTRETTWTSPV